MKMEMPKRKRVQILVHLDMRHIASQKFAGGVMRYAASHKDVEVQFSDRRQPTPPLRYFNAWAHDGLIIDSSGDAYTDRQIAALAGRVAVFVNMRPRRLRGVAIATLTSDDTALASEMALFMTRKQLRNYAFVEAPGGEPWSSTRLRAFTSALERRGARLVASFRPPAISWVGQKKALVSWLKRLPTPCGIWVAYDMLAKQVIDACGEAGLGVPDTFKIAGVDDEPFVCEHTTPSLTSIAPDFENGGFTAAEFIDKALSGRLKPHGITRMSFGANIVTERYSTSGTSGAAHRIALAQELVRKGAARRISVNELATTLGISLRQLEIDYLQITGRTMGADLREFRLERMKSLLRESDLPIKQVAGECGYASASYAQTMFRRMVGVTMLRYRNN